MTTSSFSEWLESARGPSTMGLDDHHLDDRTMELKRREEDLLSEQESLDRSLAKTMKVWREATGTGEAENGAVTVVVDAQNRVVDIKITPRALRLGSIQNLRKALLDACESAVADVQKQLDEAGGVDPGDDPLAGLLSSMPEVAAVLPYDLRHPPARPRPEDDDD